MFFNLPHLSVHTYFFFYDNSQIYHKWMQLFVINSDSKNISFRQHLDLHRTSTINMHAYVQVSQFPNKYPLTNIYRIKINHLTVHSHMDMWWFGLIVVGLLLADKAKNTSATSIEQWCNMWNHLIIYVHHRS